MNWISAGSICNKEPAIFSERYAGMHPQNGDVPVLVRELELHTSA
jgi:hypothetical protein